MQGIFINGTRPASKKQVRESVAHDASNVRLEATSPFGEYDGPVSEAEAGRYYFAGPDVYRRRNFYGQIVVAEDGSITVT